MKAVARQYFSWPRVDYEIEQYVKICDVCNVYANISNKAELIKNNDCKEVVERVHGDFLCPVKGKIYFIVMDAYSKGPEVYPMNSINSANTVNKLRYYYSRYGIPKRIVTDNGKQLDSQEFQKFCNLNGLKHPTISPWHPSSNGAAENAVKTFKMRLKKALLDPKNSKLDNDTIISRHLFAYRNAPHCYTGDSPSKLMFGKKLRTCFDLIKENSVMKKNCERQIKNHKGRKNETFGSGYLVWVLDYRDPSEVKWTKAEIIYDLGERNYICKLLKEE